MDVRGLRASVLLASEAYSVVVADTPELVAEACRLRYQVYCVEQGFEPGANGSETDGFDGRARHVLLTHRGSDAVIGTVRIIPPQTLYDNSFPMQKVCRPGLLGDLPLNTTGEISRFAVSKERRMGCGNIALVRLGLMQGIVRLSSELGLTHWCAIMEPSLLRLLQMNAIYFVPIGPCVEYHGIRQPSYGRIDTVLERIRRDQWDVWNYITLGGTLCSESAGEDMLTEGPALPRRELAQLEMSH